MQETNQQLQMITIPKMQLEELKMRIRHLENYVKVLQEDSNNDNSLSLTQTTNLYLTKQPYESNTPNKNIKSMQHCPHCNGIKKRQQRKAVISPQNLKQQLKKWSKNFNSSLSKSVRIQGQGIKQQDSREQQKSRIIQRISQQEKLTQSRLYQPRLIESVCLFGPQQESFANQVQRNFTSSTKLIYPQTKKYEVYGNYFFPQDINVKRIRSEKITTQVNRIIFKKTAKKQDTSVFLFQGQEGHPLLQQQQYDLLQLTNPGHKLYAFSIHFHDIVALLIKINSPQLPDQKQEGNLNVSTALTPKTQKNIRIQDLHSVQYGSLTNIENINTSNVYLSKFCLTLFTYFPLVNLMQDVLISILEQIKIKRLESFTKNKEQTYKIDIYYVAQQLESITRKLFKQMESFYPNISNTGTLAIGHIMIDVDLSHDAIRRYMYQGWAYQMLRMLNKQLFYDILINFILEESLCFVCEDLHFLTFFMLLFCDFIIRPLVYPHPCISVVFEQELLGTPFIVAIGINKDNKWLDENHDLIAQNKIILSLNDKITVKSKKKLKVIRSQPLKDIVRQLYKDIEILSDISYTFKTAKRQSFTKPCSQAEDKLIIKFTNQLQKYFNEEISKHLPNKQIIEVMQAETDKSNLSEQTFNIIKTVEKYYIQSRKRKQKDAFLQKFIKQQIFYVFVCKKYKLN